MKDGRIGEKAEDTGGATLRRLEQQALGSSPPCSMTLAWKKTIQYIFFEHLLCASHGAGCGGNYEIIANQELLPLNIYSLAGFPCLGHKMLRCHKSDPKKWARQ